MVAPLKSLIMVNRDFTFSYYQIIWHESQETCPLDFASKNTNAIRKPKKSFLYPPPNNLEFASTVSGDQIKITHIYFKSWKVELSELLPFDFQVIC